MIVELLLGDRQMDEKESKEKRLRGSNNIGIIISPKTGRDDDEEDIEKLKELLKAVSDFIADLKKPIEDLLKVVIDQLSGEKLGKDVAVFYKSLVEAGMDPSLVEELTKKYFEERMEAANALKSLMSSLSGAFGKGGLSKEKLIMIKNLKELGEELKKGNKTEDEEQE